MEDHTIRLDEVLPIGDGFKIGRCTIHDAEHMPATLTARDVLAQSSNTGTAQIALRSGPDRQRAFLAALGLLSPVKLRIAGNGARRFIRSTGAQVETATVGFGHGISVSPLAFVTAAAAVVNGGRQDRADFPQASATDARGEQLIKPETSATMRGLLRYVVTNGTGKKADVPGYDVGGKTGSAEKNAAGIMLPHKLAHVVLRGVSRLMIRAISCSSCWTSRMATRRRSVMALAGYTAAPARGTCHRAHRADAGRAAANPVARGCQREFIMGPHSGAMMRSGKVGR